MGIAKSLHSPYEAEVKVSDRKKKYKSPLKYKGDVAVKQIKQTEEATQEKTWTKDFVLSIIFRTSLVLIVTGALAFISVVFLEMRDDIRELRTSSAVTESNIENITNDLERLERRTDIINDVNLRLIDISNTLENISD